MAQSSLLQKANTPDKQHVRTAAVVADTLDPHAPPTPTTDGPHCVLAVALNACSLSVNSSAELVSDMYTATTATTANCLHT